MAGFVKLYQSILDSSVWSEGHATRIVWITLLAMADANGRVEASVGGLARRAQVTREEAERALEVLSSPDLDDKSGVNEGRRIEKCERGWYILNHRRYRDLRTDAQEKTNERVRRFREKTRVTETAVTGETLGNGTERTDADAEAEAYTEAEGDLDREGEPERDGALRLTPTPSAPAVARRSSKASKPRSWKRVPAEWQPSADHQQLAGELGVNFTEELAKFRDHEYPKAKSDADACFRTWLRNAKDFSRGGGVRQSGPRQPNHGAFDASVYE